MSAVNRQSEQIKYNGINSVRRLSQQLKNDINTVWRLSRKLNHHDINSVSRLSDSNK